MAPTFEALPGTWERDVEPEPGGCHVERSPDLEGRSPDPPPFLDVPASGRRLSRRSARTRAVELPRHERHGAEVRGRGRRQATRRSGTPAFDRRREAPDRRRAESSAPDRRRAESAAPDRRGTEPRAPGGRGTEPRAPD